jgi:cytochrome c556
MKALFLSIFVILTSTLSLYSAEQDIKNRQNAMQQVRESVKVLFPMAKGKTEYDDFVVISMLDQMLAAAKPYASYFPEQPEVGVSSEAAETIWTDRSGFEKALANFLTDIEVAVLAEPETLEDFKPLFADITSNCQSCHQVYRMK